MLSPSSSFISTYAPERTLSTSFCGTGSEPGDRHTPKPAGFMLGGNCGAAIIGGKLCTGRVAAGDWVAMKGAVMGVAPPDQITPDTAAGWDPPGAKDTEVTAVAGGSTPKPHPCCAPPVVKTEK